MRVKENLKFNTLLNDMRIEFYSLYSNFASEACYITQRKWFFTHNFSFNMVEILDFYSKMVEIGRKKHLSSEEDFSVTEERNSYLALCFSCIWQFGEKHLSLSRLGFIWIQFQTGALYQCIHINKCYCKLPNIKYNSFLRTLKFKK